MVQGLAQPPGIDGSRLVLLKELRPARGVGWVNDGNEARTGTPMESAISSRSRSRRSLRPMASAMMAPISGTGQRRRHARIGQADR